MQTIDLTPTWADILPAMLAVLDRGDDCPAHSREFIYGELKRMAEIADKYVAYLKAGA